MTEAEKRFKRERGGGNYGLGTKEVQEKRYIERREAERKRRELFSDALAMYKKGDLENVRLMHVQTLAATCSVAHVNIGLHVVADWSLLRCAVEGSTSRGALTVAAQALIEFENVLATEPKNYVGDDFSRVTQTYRVTQYNIACCYAAMGQVRSLAMRAVAVHVCSMQRHGTSNL